MRSNAQADRASKGLVSALNQILFEDMLIRLYTNQLTAQIFLQRVVWQRNGFTLSHHAEYLKTQFLFPIA